MQEIKFKSVMLEEEGLFENKWDGMGWDEMRQ